MNVARRWQGDTRLALAWAAVAVLLAAGVLALGFGARAASERAIAASQADVAASLARGVAWIWPDSNGPRSADAKAAPYTEAAVLVESLVLRARGIERGGRTQPLRVPAGVRILPVLHIEAAEDAPAALTPAQRDAIVAAARRHAAVAAAGAGVLQLDFEAPARQREAYRDLVAGIRQALPAQVRLSVTALAH